MDDAISRSAVLAGAEEIDWYHVNQNGKLVSGSTSDDVSYVKYDDVVHMLENAPALDAVPVVRCKDCKYAHSGNGIWYWCGTDERKRPGSFYCSAGRKKDECDD